MIDLVFNNFTVDKKYGDVFFVRVIGAAVKEVGLDSKKIGLSVNLVGEGKIKSLNRKYRGRNRTTDVLSFPLQEQVSLKKAESVIISLGDIFICLPVAKKEAQREEVSLDYKLAFLTVHGFLHLLGYGHEKSEDQEVMFSLQDRTLNKLNL